MKLARRLLRTAPLAPYVAYEAYPGDHIQSDEELMAIGRERGTTTYHLMGTCRMGRTATRQRWSTINCGSRG